MSNEGKIHFRKAFNSPYLSSADIVEPTVLTVHRVGLDPDKTKKTKDAFNTAYFVEKEIRKGEPLKPMILNATNSKTLKELAGSAFIDDWTNIRITVYVDNNVRYGKETMDGLRISPQKPKPAEKKFLDPGQTDAWDKARLSLKNTGSLALVLKHMNITEAHQKQLKDEADAMA